jgi:hypothetical protein
MPGTQIERVDAGVATTDADLDDDGPYPVWAPVLAPGDVTRGGDGSDDGGGSKNEQASHWTPDALAQLETVANADMESGRRHHFIAGHPHNPGATDVLGEATRATLSEQFGFVVEGEVDSPDTARLIKNGRVGISPYLARTLSDDRNEDVNAYDVEDVVGLRDYGIVLNGESPSEQLRLGESPLARARDEDTAPSAEALSAVFDPASGPESGPETAGTRAGASHSGKQRAGKKHPETMADSDPTDPTDRLEARIADLEAKNAELREQRDEDLEAEIEQLRDQLDTLQGEKSTLEAEKKDIESERDALAEQIEPAEQAAAEALAEHDWRDAERLRAETDFGEMVEALSRVDDPNVVETDEGPTWNPAPQTGDPGQDGSGGSGGSGGSIEALSADKRSTVEALANRAETMESVGNDERAEELRDQAAETVGTDADDIDWGAV